MRLAYVCADGGVPLLGHKGASVHARSITAGLQRRGNQVTVVCARLGEGNPPPVVEAIIEVGLDPTKDRIRPILEAAGAEAVIERYALESGPARRASTELGLPHVLEVNAPIALEAHRHRGLADLGSALDREHWLFGATDAVIVVSRGLAAYVRVVARSARVAWVPNGVDVAAFTRARPASMPVPSDAVVVGFMGSMKAWHGVTDLIVAFRSLADTNPAAHLVLVGTGPEEVALRERVSSDPVLSAVTHFTGAVPYERVPTLLAAFDVGVAPYLPSEDFYFCPLKVLEYLAAGLPVIYPRLGDIPELVGAAGVSYRAGDTEDLAATLRHLVGNSQHRAELSANARSQAKRWSWGEAARAVERVVVDVCRAGRGEA